MDIDALIAFLRARYNEDEQEAAGTDQERGRIERRLGGFREILDATERELGRHPVDEDGDTSIDSETFWTLAWVLRRLGFEYDGHPDYQRDWRP